MTHHCAALGYSKVHLWPQNYATQDVIFHSDILEGSTFNVVSGKLQFSCVERDPLKERGLVPERNESVDEL